VGGPGFEPSGYDGMPKFAKGGEVFVRIVEFYSPFGGAHLIFMQGIWHREFGTLACLPFLWTVKELNPAS
jgi:hypothetical protein